MNKQRSKGGRRPGKGEDMPCEINRTALPGDHPAVDRGRAKRRT
jgi:hypothetical protein